MDSATTIEVLTKGRQAFRDGAWTDAYTCLSAVDRERALAPEDLECLAIATNLLGREDEGYDVWTRAHHAFLHQGATQRAARCAFWIGFALMFADENARSSGWLARSRRLIAEAGLDCVERGYLLLPEALQSHWQGESGAAFARFEEASRIGERFAEPDLIAMSRMGMGETLIHLGEARRGLGLLDEAMASVTSGELSAMPVGIIYCFAISCCQRILDFGRAREWTAAFTRWCATQPDLAPFRGICLVHRAEVLQFRGAWPAALAEVQHACERIDGPACISWAGSAYYQQGELYRLRGEYAKAEEAYRLANEWGQTPQPGLALLRLAQGRPEIAAGAIARALGEARDNVARSKLLPAHVEIMLALKDRPAAKQSADELSEIAAGLDVPLLHAMAAYATGAVLLAEGDLSGALAALRPALATWQTLDVPYEAARVRVLIAKACRSLGDSDGAQLELDAARQTFHQIGAQPDLERLAVASRKPVIEPLPGGLTTREVEVLCLVASGRTNRGIAEELVLSEKTVARHVSNIFGKLGLSSRSAVTAYAYEHGLLPRSA